MNGAQWLGLAVILLSVALAAGLTVGIDRALRRYAAKVPDVGLAVFVEDQSEDDGYYPPGVCGVCDGCEACKCDGCDECNPVMGCPMVIDEEVDRVLPEPPPFERTNLGFGRRNPHCSNCGDLRGGGFGHESSECKYRYGMTAGEVAAILPEHQRNEFWDQQIDRYFAEQERAS